MNKITKIGLTVITIFISTLVGVKITIITKKEVVYLLTFYAIFLRRNKYIHIFLIHK